MQFRIERSNSDIGRIKVIRRKTASARTSRFKRIVRVPKPPIRKAIEPSSPPHDAPLASVVDDGSPAARAGRVRRLLRRLFKMARRAAEGQARLFRADEYELLRCAYVAVRCWQQNGLAEEIERELRAEAEVAISGASGLFLVLLRSALPHLDAKRASKSAAALEFADHHDIRSQRLPAFLGNSGGIEGAAHGRAKLRANGDV